MTERSALYTGVSRAAWGYLFLYVDFNLGPVSVLPAFVGWLLFLSAIGLLAGERRELALLRPFGIIMALWKGADWLLSWAGLSVNGHFLPAELLVGAVSLYFHFQLFTDFAALAERYQPRGASVDRRLLRWRTVQAVLTTALALLSCTQVYWGEWQQWMLLGLAAVWLLVALCLMAALFALRRCFREEAAQKEA